MKEETPAAIKAICLSRGLDDKPDQNTLNEFCFELDLGEIGNILAWGAHFSGVYLDLEQGYEETVRILETEDIELFTRALDDLIASCKRFSEYLEQAKQEQP